MCGTTTALKTVESYEMRIAPIAQAPLDQLHALSIAVQWPHRAEDWAFLRKVGQGFVALDEIDRIAGSIMWFPYTGGVHHLGMMVISPRLQNNGTGQWLMSHVMKELEGQSIGLSATRASRRLFRSCGFLPGKTIYQCQGRARLPTRDVQVPPDHVLRPLMPEDLDAVIALDHSAFGSARSVLMAALFAESAGYGLFHGDAIAAFSLCRPFGRGHVVGPVVARTDDAAMSICMAHVKTHEGGFLRLDTDVAFGAFADFLSDAGLAVYDTVLNMTLNPATAAPQALRLAATYGLASQAVG